jgi:hypothetical protein
VSVAIELAFAALGGTTKIEMILFLSLSQALLCTNITNFRKRP